VIGEPFRVDPRAECGAMQESVAARDRVKAAGGIAVEPGKDTKAKSRHARWK
jgi:hypothetical protein